MQKLAEICVERPVFATVLVLVLVVVGALSYGELGLDRFPDVDFPFVTVTTRLPGSAPEEMETDVTDKLEDAVSSISGVDELRSFSSEGFSVLAIGFGLEKNGDVGAQEVRDKINGATFDLPRGIDPPIVEKIDADATPILAVIVSNERMPKPADPNADIQTQAAQNAVLQRAIRDLTEFSDKVLRRNLGSVAGVGQVRVVGGRERQIRVTVDVARLAGYGLTAAQVTQALQTQNVQLPGGRVEQGARDLSLRTYGRVQSVEELGDVAVGSRGGHIVRLRDVAAIEDATADPETTAFWNGQSAVTLLVRKQSGANTVATVDAVRDRVDSLRGLVPEGYKVDIARDQSEFIRTSIEAVREHLVLGSLLAAGVVWLFLRRIRPTLIAALSIPTSIIASFAALRYMGFTLNTITLLALTLVVGIVIDDAVIVIENVFRLLEEKKLTGKAAAIQGTREIGLAVLATTLSLIAVFLPIGFMSGIVGRFMGSFGITMSFAIFISMIVAFTITPMLCARWLRASDAQGGSHHESGPSGGLYGVIEQRYLSMLRWAMDHRGAMLGILLLVFLSTGPLGRIANKNFLPTDDEGQFEILVRAPEGYSLASTETFLESIAKQVRALEGVEATLTTIGTDSLRTQNAGSIYVKMKPLGERTMTMFDAEDAVRDQVLPQYASLKARMEVSRVGVIGSGNNATIQFWVGGPDLGKLQEYSNQLLETIRAVPGVVDPLTDLIIGRPELGIRIDRDKAAELGVRVSDIASTAGLLVGGAKVSDYYERGEQYDVWVRAAAADRASTAAIAELRVPSATLGSVRLGDVARFEGGTGPAIVNRISRTRQVLITCNVRPGFSEQAVIQALNDKAASLGMPAGYTYGLTGRSREQGRAARAFGLAFISSIIFMYLVLAAQFESWLHPITILMALPMTVPFALLSIVAFNQSINIYSALGIMVLFGIVKKNGILQIDHTNNLRAQGMNRYEAIIQANKDRLRPILMTTLAFVAGMMPLAVSSGAGSGSNRSISIVIIGGQTLALLLTLLAIPVLYALFDDWTEALRRRFGSVAAPAGDATLTSA